MRNTLILLLILLSLGAVYFLMPKGEEKKSSIKMEDRDFVIEDRDDIYTITIESEARPTIHLSRKEGIWLINGKHKAKPNVMSNMTMALSNMAISYIPMKAENVTAHKRIDKFGIGIKAYDKDGEVLTDFILGPNINSEYGTYIIKRGAEQAYVMSLPAQAGGLRGYFNHDVEVLRDLNLLNLEADDIQTVEVTYPKDKINSYKIDKSSGQYKLTSLQKEYEDKPLNVNVVDAFFKDFKAVNAERLRNGHLYKDSISNTLPFMTVKVDLKDGESYILDTYPFIDFESKYVTRRVKDVTERHQQWYVNTSWGDFYQIQTMFIKPFMKKVEDFY